MARNYMTVGFGAALCAVMMLGCKSDTPVTPPPPPGDTQVPVPAGVTAILSEGFGGDLSSWKDSYLIKYGDPTYPRMRITTAAAHTGTHSVTSDTTYSALEYDVANRIEAGIGGVQFYIYATAKGQANFSVQFGQNAGSSGGLGHAYGLGFGRTDSITTFLFDYMAMNQYADSAIEPIQLNHWYKCVIEIDFTGGTISYFLDDKKIRSAPLPTQDWYGIDRLLVFRGTNPYEEAAGLDKQAGPKPYYADDIVLYKK
jgi:hypothetical protein